MRYGEPYLNEGKDWSEMDLFDLKKPRARHLRGGDRRLPVP
jgi:hypothetical protein